MERIKEAVEQARRERQRETGASASHAESRELGVGGPTISYSTTRVVEIDHQVLARNRILLGHDTDDASSAYKILRTQVQQRLSASGWNALAITSPMAGEGKTLTAINLSIALAREIQHTVLLVDLDMRKPSLHSKFGLQPKYGIVDYLLNDVPLGEILVNPGIERLVLLPAGRAVPDSSELLASPKMAQLVDELKSRYPSRIVIFDLPPLLLSDDMLAFSPYVDTTLLVVEDGHTTREQLRRAVEMLDGTHLLGTVLNKAQDVSGRYAR